MGLFIWFLHGSMLEVYCGEGGSAMNQQRFAGRSAVVTGGASGIGLGVARRILDEGGAVTIWDRAALDAELGRNARALIVDVTDAEAIAAAAVSTAAAQGGIDILVTSAAITGPNA